MPDLLPDDFGTETLTPPIVVLREQAEHLTRRLGGLVIAKVVTTRHPGDPSVLLHRFMVEVPSLDDYTFALFSVIHPLTLYPLDIQAQSSNGLHYSNISSPAGFESALRDVFSSSEFKRIIAALKAQAVATATSEL